MKTITAHLGILYFSTTILLAPAAAMGADMAKQLQTGLFEEEGNRNLDAAIEAYQGVVSQLEAQRQFGATAIYRLGECYRKKGDLQRAFPYYRRILHEFPDQTNLAELSSLRLEGLGAAPAEPDAPDRAGSSNPVQLGGIRAELARVDAILEQFPPEDPLNYKETILTVVEDQPLAALLNRESEIEQELESLKSEYGANHPHARNAANRLDLNTKQAAKRIQGILDGLKLKRAILQRQLQALSSSVGASPGTALSPPSKSDLLLADLVQLERDLVDVESDLQALRTFDRAERAQGIANEHEHDTLRELLARRAEQERVTKQLAGTYTPQHPELAAELKTLNRIDEQIETQVSAFLDGLEAKARLYRARIGRIKAALPISMNPDYQPESEAEAEALKEARTLVEQSPDKIQSLEHSPLTSAAVKGHMAVVRYLLEHGADPNAVDKDGNGPIHQIISIGNLAMVKLLIEHGAHVDGTENFFETPLHTAVRAGRPKIAAFLLEQGADPNRTTERRVSALHAAAGRNNANLIRVLLDQGGDPSLRTEQGLNSLDVASLNQHPSNVRLLLEHGADPRSANSHGTTPLHHALASSTEPPTELLRLLIDSGSDPNRKQAPDSPAPLTRAVHEHWPETIRLLGQHGASVEDMDGTPLLHIAVRNGAYETAAALLGIGASPNAFDSSGLTALDMLEISLQHNASPSRSLGGRPDTKLLQRIKSLLIEHGAHPWFGRDSSIFVTRESSGFRLRHVIRSKILPHRYTLLELLAHVYNDRLVYGGNSPQSCLLAFPMLDRILIRRMNSGGEERTLEVNVFELFKNNSGERDFDLEWGDIVEIAESVHQVGAKWNGLGEPVLQRLDEILLRRIDFQTPKQSRQVALLPPWNSRLIDRPFERVETHHRELGILRIFRWNQRQELQRESELLLETSGLEGEALERKRMEHAEALEKKYGKTPISAIRGFQFPEFIQQSGLALSTSDLSRVKVLRTNRKGQTQEHVFDLTQAAPTPNIWLEDGDTIVIPDRDAGEQQSKNRK